MDRTAALGRLGLTGNEDAAGVTRAYGQRLSTVQEKLVTAQTDAERAQHQTALSGLVEAYEYLTESGRFTRASVDDAGATVLRDGSTPPPASIHATQVRMGTGAVLSGRLEIGELLGQGGMGYVYAAHDRLRNEDVAIKVLRQDLTFSTAAKERFLAEARVSSNLSHQNIVRVYDVGEAGGHYYLSMERLKGQTLRQRIEEYSRAGRAFSVTEVTGIARAYSSSQLTQTGMTLGTAYYMAPEQRLAAKEVDWRADQYALGVVLYELLAGTIPMGAVKPLGEARRDIPVRYAQAVMRAMSPRPDDRWPSLDDLLAELEMPAGRGSKAAVWVVLGSGLAAAAVAGAYYMTREQPATVAESIVRPAQSVTTAVPADNSGSQPPPSPPVETAAAQSPPESPPAPIVESTPPQQTAVPVATERVPPAAPVKVAKVDDSAQVRRQECLAQCERWDGECRSINRRGKQDCMRAVGFGATGGFTVSPGVNSASADCAFYGQTRCEYARDRNACLSRISARYNACVTLLSGNVASRRQDCDNNAREADRMCLDEMRDCKSYCE